MKEKIKKYTAKWELIYKDGIPDEAPTRLEELGKAPSYRMICKAILKNDTQLESLGYSKTKSIYYSDFKHIELSKKGIIKQLNLFK